LTTVEECLRELGYPVTPLEEQHTFDGGFPNVPFRIPNPEVPESMEQAMRKAKAIGADLVLATDPDADRIGVAVPVKGEFIFLTGNQIAAIVTHYLLETRQAMGKLPSNPIVVKTEVTTELITAIARHFGAQVVGDLLVGFKYVADVLHELETNGRFGAVKGALNDFVIGVEESHGILVTPEMRDKDAAGAAVYLAELASLQKSKGSSSYDYLNAIYKKFGYYVNSLTSTIMLGAAGVASITKIQDELRRHPPKEVAGVQVVRSKDYWDEAAFGPFKSLTDKSSRNLLVFYLEGGPRILIRPSGTEPKNKIYYEAKSEPLGTGASDDALRQTKEATDALLLKISHGFTKRMLEIINIRLPDWALWVSDLVALDWKVDFAEKFIPELQAQAEEVLNQRKSFEEVQRWIDNRLKPYGNDARGLVARAFRAYLDSRTPDTAKMRTQVMERLFFAS
jgi:phosphoglucomutase/phosphomannomutase